MIVGGLNQGRNCPAQFQWKDEEVLLLDVLVLPVVVVQLHRDPVSLLAA